MKLNNKGWGTTEMLLLSWGLLIALLVAIYFISKLYGSLELSTANRYYFDLENKLRTSAKNYVNDYNIEVNGSLIVNLSTLKGVDSDLEIKDKDGNLCSGYVSIVNTNGINNYSAFISCPDYETNNY